MARLHPRTRTPVIALVAQCAWALALVSLGTYGELLDWVVFADWLTFGSVAPTLLVYRRRLPPSRLLSPAGLPGYVKQIW